MPFTDSELTLFKQVIADFAQKEILPHRSKWDEEQFFPVELFKKMGEMGLMGMVIPVEYGGAGLSYQEYASALIEVSKVCGGVGLSLAAHNSLCTNHIYMFGTEYQKKKWLPKLTSGETVGAWGLTEPNTGSDAKAMKTTAIKKGDKWVLNGAKNFITHGKTAETMVVIVRTGEVNTDGNASAFVIERGTPGFSAGRKEDKLGMRASETTEVIFDNCEIPEENLLGEVGNGFRQAMQILDGGRISIASLSLGIAIGAFDAAVQYAKEREQFGKSISKFQGVSFPLADAACEIEAAKALLEKAAVKKDNGEKVTKLSAMAKLFCSELCVDVATKGVQVFGGYGYIKEFPAEKYYRDSKLCTIGEGTSEIQKLVISREIFK